MKGLENILDKILNDANEEANKIIKEAEDKKKEILDESEKKSKIEADKIISKAELEKGNILKRAQSTKELNARDKILTAKQDRIENILEKVIEELKNLSDEDFVKYVKNNISDIDVSKEAVLKVPSRYKEAIKRADLGYEISNEDFDEGFELNYKNLRYNGDFNQIIDSKREDLEGFLVEKLFN